MAQYPPPPPQQQPVYYPVYYPAPQPQKRSGCLTCFLITLVVSVVGCVVLAGAGVGDARTMFKWNKAQSPLKKSIEIDDVGGAALYLLSDLSRAVTGEIHFVDAGFNVVGMPQTSELKGWTDEEG